MVSKRNADELAAVVFTPWEAAMVAAADGDRTCREAQVKRKPAFIDRLMHDLWDTGLYDSDSPVDRLVRLIADGWSGKGSPDKQAKFFREVVPLVRGFLDSPCGDVALRQHLAAQPEVWFAIALYDRTSEEALGEVYLASVQAMIGMRRLCVCHEDVQAELINAA